ncbi:uncharacterized protein BO80DRAFT_156257 [Aspergillus ibericus CBS 121593]|uniref:Uncharacterized protein n=1 Tax=Aspergillus ibericus CBS 121593 TaxID=1448316 RepID=A0A395GTF8_9EURO|nr:hypothetical protein BO80DRAFT_156257 [Aspergillus ibericus CBS 121593]RAK98682.1 hypothetical protein BO80DRAFT_156257 [Aspergillus ibericus CBS 121593]
MISRHTKVWNLKLSINLLDCSLFEREIYGKKHGLARLPRLEEDHTIMALYICCLLLTFPFCFNEPYNLDRIGFDDIGFYLFLSS